MSDKWQKELKNKISDLKESLKISNMTWNEWEVNFIQSVSQKLGGGIIQVTPKQWEMIENLWERI